MANPTSRGNMPRPPLNLKGGRRSSELPTGLLRKIAHRFENVPRWPLMIKWDNIVQTTLNVQIL